jgi:hypothetical protein
VPDGIWRRDVPSASDSQSLTAEPQKTTGRLGATLRRGVHRAFKSSLQRKLDITSTNSPLATHVPMSPDLPTTV